MDIYSSNSQQQQQSVADEFTLCLQYNKNIDSNNYYPQNNPADFKIKLNGALNLLNGFEVAITKFYSRMIKYVLPNDDADRLITITYPSPDDGDNRLVKKLHMRGGSYTTLYNFINSIKDLVRSKFDGIDVIELNYNRFRSKIVLNVEKDYQISFSNVIRDILGLEHNTYSFNEEEKPHANIKLPKLYQNMDYIYICSDIGTHYTYINQKKDCILASCPVDETSLIYGEMIYQEFNPVNYMEVTRNIFNSINIELKNQKLKKISGLSKMCEIYLELHFRRL